MKYAISMWSHRGDNAVRSGEADWDELKEFLKDPQVTTDKHSVALFNLNRFEGTDVVFRDGEKFPRRCGENVVEITGLMIDYDNDSLLQDKKTIQEVRQEFKQHTHVIYTSYNHLYKGRPEKFRLVLPFKDGMPYERFKEVVDDIKHFVGYKPAQRLPEEFQYVKNGHLVTSDKSTIDNVSFNPVQGFYVPSCPPESTPEFYENDGELLDWRRFKKRLQLPDTIKVELERTGVRGGDGIILKHTFDIVQWCKDKGLYQRKLSDGKHQITCPLVHEHTGGDKSGTIVYEAQVDRWPNLYCQHGHRETLKGKKLFDLIPDDELRQYCETKPYVDPAEQFLTERQRQRRRESQEEKDVEYVEPYDRETRHNLLLKRYAMVYDEPYINLFAVEGFGKSSLALDVSQGFWYDNMYFEPRAVLFTCNSNVQVSEQAQSFRDRGARVQEIHSRADTLWTDYNVICEVSDPSDPWAPPTVRKAATIKKMVKQLNVTKEQADAIWNATAAELPDFNKHDIVVCTHSRAHGWGIVQGLRGDDEFTDTIVPYDAVIFCDDPPASLLKTLKDFDNKYAHTKINGRLIERTSINNREYFVRPEHYKFGFGYEDNTIIFCTTEMLVRELIHTKYGGESGVAEPKIMPPKKVKAGHITVFLTNRVYKKWDGILLPVMERLRKLKANFKFQYFADGQGCQYNLTNNKGQNIFSDVDTIIEISQPHGDKCYRWCDELGWDISTVHQVKQIIAMDTMHQAIGRNAGYRWADKNQAERRETIVLLDPKMSDIIELTRYYIERIEDLNVSRRTLVEPSEVDGSLIDWVAWLVGNIRQYLYDGRKFEFDCRTALSSVKDPRRKQQRKYRMFEALKTAGKTFGDVEYFDKIAQKLRE